MLYPDIRAKTPSREQDTIASESETLRVCCKLQYTQGDAQQLRPSFGAPIQAPILTHALFAVDLNCVQVFSFDERHPEDPGSRFLYWAPMHPFPQPHPTYSRTRLGKA